MSIDAPENIFRAHLILGYVACLLFFGTYAWPRLKAMPRFEAQRAIATFHSFRFFGLAFILPGVVGRLPPGFAGFAAWGDFATGLLALAALAAARVRGLFWPLVVAYNVVGAADILVDYTQATLLDLPAHAGELGALYAIPVLYVPLLMITHFTAFRLLPWPRSRLAMA
ncbi:MAG TPA: hypothetical protein VFA75_07810 [Nevskia sp.]|nr:hypothetical protein [Nevskia sp.]